MKIKETKEKIIEELEDRGIDKKEAIELCEEYGWEVIKGKYFLESKEDKVVFNSDEEIINYAKELKEKR